MLFDRRTTQILAGACLLIGLAVIAVAIDALRHLPAAPGSLVGLLPTAAGESLPPDQD